MFWEHDVPFMDAFAEDATWDDGFRLHAVRLTAFDLSWVAAEFMQSDVDTVGPVAHAPTANVATIAIGHKLTVNGTIYQIVGVQPDGNGLTQIRLSKDG